MKYTYKYLVGKPEGKTPLERTSRRWEDIRMDLIEIRWEGVDWMHLVRDRDKWRAHVKTVMNFLIP